MINCPGDLLLRFLLQILYHNFYISSSMKYFLLTMLFKIYRKCTALTGICTLLVFSCHKKISRCFYYTTGGSFFCARFLWLGSKGHLAFKPYFKWLKGQTLIKSVAIDFETHSNSKGPFCFCTIRRCFFCYTC